MSKAGGQAAQTRFSDAWQEWRASEQGRVALNPKSLGPLKPAEYLENRLHNAFAAGWRSALASIDPKPLGGKSP